MLNSEAPSPLQIVSTTKVDLSINEYLLPAAAIELRLS